MSGIKIAPSILTADFANLERDVLAAEAAGVDYIHLDVMDGHFVPPITFGTAVVEAIRKVTRLPLDIHLMIASPERHIESFAQAGGDILNVHVEACGDARSVLAQIKGLDRKAGVCLNPETPLSAIESFLDSVDQVIVMGVNPGWGGQKLIAQTLPKIERLRALLEERGLSPEIEIDGGVKSGNVADCVRAGAQVVVAGSSVYNSQASVRDNVRALRDAITAATT